MSDNLCDTCKKPMEIKRSGKNSRFLVCVNPDCKRKTRGKGPTHAPIQQLAAQPAPPSELGGGRIPPDVHKRPSFFSLR